MEKSKEILTRRELYGLVWSNSLVSLSKKYNISDNGLRKVCRRMNIPLPKAGHWVKLQFGKKVRITPLPALYGGDTEVTLSFRTGDERTDRNKLAVLAKAIKEDPSLSLQVPSQLRFPDKLIIDAKQQLTGKEAFEPSNYKGVVACRRGQLDIRVAPNNVRRALRIMDTFIKALRARKHDIEFRNGLTYATVKGQRFRISLREKMKKVVIHERWERKEYHPSGALSFKMEGYHDKEWKDGKEPLENRLADILAKLEIVSDLLTNEQQYHQKRWDEQREKERLIQEYKERQEKELADFREMLAKAERWHKAANLRDYINEVEQRAISTQAISEDLKNWLGWARKKADWYDPFTEAEDSLLTKADRILLRETKRTLLN